MVTLSKVRIRTVIFVEESKATVVAPWEIVFISGFLQLFLVLLSNPISTVCAWCTTLPAGHVHGLPSVSAVFAHFKFAVARVVTKPEITAVNH